MGLLATAALFDAVYVVHGGQTWALVAFYMIGAATVGLIAILLLRETAPLAGRKVRKPSCDSPR